MTPLNCLRTKIKSGIVERTIGMDLASMIETFEETYAKRLGARDAAVKAAEQALDDSTKIAARKAEIALGTAEAQLMVLKRQHAYEVSYGTLLEQGKQPLWQRGVVNLVTGKQDVNRSPLPMAMRSFFDKDPAEIVPGINVTYESKNIIDQSHVLFREALGELQPKMLGLKAERALEIDVLDALFDKAAQVSPQARTVMESWGRTHQFLWKAANDVGIRIAEREDWRIPNPRQDPLKVRSIAFDDYRDLVLRTTKREAMVDFETGAVLSNEKLDRLIAEMHQSVINNGADGPPSAARQGRSMLASRHSDMRFLIFKDAASWREFAETVGETSSVYEVMTNHISRMADDIALVKVLGPNPEGTIQFMRSLFDREAARFSQQARLANPKDADAALKANTRIEAQLRSGRRSFDNLVAEVTNANNVPVNIEWAHRASEARSGFVAVQMGSAVISSITDPWVMMSVARMNDLPALAMISRAIKGMTEKDFDLNAAQLGVAATSIAHVMRSNDRFIGDTVRTGKAAQLANVVIRASGLRRTTAVLRASFAMETMGAMANRMKTGFRDLPAGNQAMLERYGLGIADWDVIRTAIPQEPTPNARFLTANSIREIGTTDALRAADRWQQMINSEMDHAVIEGSATSNAFFKGQSQPGTISGEVRRFFRQYKGFGLTFANSHMARATARGWDGERLSHAGITFIGMWMMGMVAFQAKQVANGKDPVSMDPNDPKGLRAWGAAAIQGGGFGIFGDFLFQDQTRNGATMVATAAGPAAAVAEKVLGDFILANLGRAVKGEKTHFAGDALYAAAGLVPGSSLWYARLALQRSVIDQLALMIDDRAPERFARIERDAQKQWGQSFHWGPGRFEPGRAPDVSAAFGR